MKSLQTIWELIQTIWKLYKKHCLKEPENLQRKYPFADLLDEKDKKEADNTLEKGQLIQVDEDISRDAMVKEKIVHLMKDVYMENAVILTSDLIFADVSKATA